MKNDKEIMIIFFVKASIRVSEWTRDEVSRMKLNADGVCVMSGCEELLRDDKFAVAQ